MEDSYRDVVQGAFKWCMDLLYRKNFASDSFKFQWISVKFLKFAKPERECFGRFMGERFPSVKGKKRTLWI